MTLDEAIKRYTDNAEYERAQGNLQGCLDFRQLAEWLSELKQLREKTKWTPVSDGLPKDDDLYFVTFDNGENDLVAFDRGAFSYSGVIAWMPSPESYKESEGEE